MYEEGETGREQEGKGRREVGWMIASSASYGYCTWVLTSINDALGYNSSELGESVLVLVGYDLGKVLAVEGHLGVHCF